ncbi:tetratricopeptide repeat protein [Streptomyces sp. NPDC006259]|uniref:tetratricopeptide repeat protein n=1 Tax=Streptomyces sp. NPDC006259 TaxID=3364740 RepID=UPI0036AC339F
MNRVTVEARRKSIGFLPVKALLSSDRTDGWPREALIGLKLISPDDPACAVMEETESLTDAAQAHDRIRFFLKDRLVRNFRDVGRAWIGDSGPILVEVVGCEHLDEGSRLFFETLATLSTEVTVRLLPGAADADISLNYEENGRERRIERLCSATGRLEESDLEFLLEETDRYLSLGDSWSSERILQIILQHRAEPAVWGKLGLSYAMQGRTMEAEFCYLRWRESPSVVAAAGADYALSMLYARHHPPFLRSLDKTAEFLEHGYAMLQDTQSANVENLDFHKVFNRNGYALVEFRRGNVEEAIALLTDGIAHLRSGSAKNHMHQTVLIYNLAQCHRRSGNHAQAIEVYEQLLDLDGKMPEYHMELAHCHLDLGNFPKALECLLTARTLGPSIQEVHSLLGFTYLRLDRVHEAVSSYRAAHEYAPDDRDALYDLAYALGESEDPAPALKLLLCVDLSDLSAESAVKFLTLAAEQHAAVGDLTSAREALERVVMLAPDDSDARANLDQVVAAMTE